ncbi:hypothetical protein Raf01_40490 [Rugosimonospora africana]|uniref:Uncharacterized protein n=1 Tax=Rugosimonospora africana TaxID=556532 RepID=A0A8J3QTU7_9ACTN|nr:hypothetical protein Raf01_40490 [Rugosimonospora africana]
MVDAGTAGQLVDRERRPVDQRQVRALSPEVDTENLKHAHLRDDPAGGQYRHTGSRDAAETERGIDLSRPGNTRTAIRCYGRHAMITQRGAR